MSLRSWQVLGMMLAGLLLFTWGMSHQEITSFDSRFYLFALEMWRHGVSWFPTTYHQPYPDYPVTATWFIFLSASIVGQLNKLTAILPTAVMASLTLVLTWLTGENQQRRLGTYAVCLLLMTAGFINEARSISLDMAVTWATVSCFYILSHAEQWQRPRVIGWIYPFLVFGFAIRGPIGLIIPASVVCVFYLASRQYWRFISTGLLALAALLLCSVVLLGIAYHAGGAAFVDKVVRMQFASRMTSDYLPPYFYFSNGLSNDAIALPLALLCMAGVVVAGTLSGLQGRSRVFLMRLTGWVLIIMLGMSIPGDKRIRYILPILPAAALLAAYPLTVTQTERYFYQLGWLMRRLFLFVPAILGTLLLLIAARAPWPVPSLSSTVMLLACLQLLSIGFWLIWHDDLSLLVFAVVSFLTVYLHLYEPAVLYVERGREFVQHVDSYRAAHGGHLYFYAEKPDGLPIKYLANTQNDIMPVFINESAGLRSVSPHAVTVLREQLFNQLPAPIKTQFVILDSGMLGHVKLIAIINKVAYERESSV